MDKVLKALGIALNRIDEGWTKGAPAKDAEGYVTGYNNDRACCWCLWGAIHHGLDRAKCSGQEGDIAFMVVSDVIDKSYNKRLGSCSPQSHIINFNEMPGRTSAQVASVLSYAIADVSLNDVIEGAVS